MYFEDLSGYSYLGSTGTKALNVGWLDEHHDYHQAPTVAAATERLALLCAKPVNRTRGYHSCPFCKPGDRYPIQERLVGDEPISLGSAEIRVVADNGTVFAAPDLIIHYVRRHGYRPPDPFLEALQSGSEEELLARQMKLDEL